jgi:hypothetical protein
MLLLSNGSLDRAYLMLVLFEMLLASSSLWTLSFWNLQV